MENYKVLKVDFLNFNKFITKNLEYFFVLFLTRKPDIASLENFCFNPSNPSFLKKILNYEYTALKNLYLYLKPYLPCLLYH
jgi:hypothetical protein